MAPLGIFLQKLNSESYLFARLDFLTQNLDSTRHFRYISVRDFNIPKMAKFGIKIGQIRPYNGTKKIKTCLASYFALKILVLKFQPFLTAWSFCGTTFQNFPKWPKLVHISKSPNFYPKYAPGTILKLFDPLETKLRARLEPNIAPMGLPKIFL